MTLASAFLFALIIPQAGAAQIFARAEALCRADAGALWGRFALRSHDGRRSEYA